LRGIGRWGGGNGGIPGVPIRNQSTPIVGLTGVDDPPGALAVGETGGGGRTGSEGQGGVEIFGHDEAG